MPKMCGPRSHLCGNPGSRHGPPLIWNHTLRYASSPVAHYLHSWSPRQLHCGRRSLQGSSQKQRGGRARAPSPAFLPTPSVAPSRPSPPLAPSPPLPQPLTARRPRSLGPPRRPTGPAHGTRSAGCGAPCAGPAATPAPLCAGAWHKRPSRCR